METTAIFLVVTATILPPLLIYRIRRELRDAWWFGGFLNTVWLLAGFAAVEQFWPSPPVPRGPAGDCADSDQALAFILVGPLILILSIAITSIVVLFIALLRPTPAASTTDSGSD